MFKGSIVALITPFKNNKIDEDRYASLIHYHISNGTNGLVPAGTTGESPTLDHDEHKKVIEIAVKESNGKIPVIAGTGSNSTSEAIELSQHAEKAGANALLIVTPYYNKPTQEGLYQHYKTINDNVGIPIIIYNIPPRSVVDMSVDTMARLYELKNIAGVKDATADLNRVDLQLKKMGPEFIQLSGEDGTAMEFNLRGGVGCISVTANVAAKLCSEFQKFSLIKDDKFAEWENVHGNYYGTLKSYLDSAIDEKRIILLELDVNGTSSIQNLYPNNSHSIFIAPPNIEALR
mgnify:CR=1 FL=1